MTRFWQRRIAVIAMITGASIALLYGLSFFTSNDAIEHNTILGTISGAGLFAAIVGIVTFIIGLYTFFAARPETLTKNAQLAYVATLLALAVLIYATGSYESPFALFWGIIAVAAPFFGAWGVIPVILMAIAVAVLSIITGGQNPATVWLPTILAAAPVLFGYLIKPVQNTKTAETAEDRSYSALARELGQVASKSEVVINAIGEGVLAVDGKGVIEVFNPAAVQLIGWGKNDAMGLSYKSVLKLVDSRGNELDSAHDPVATTFAANKPTGPGEYTLLTQSDKNIVVSVLVSPIGQPGEGAIIVFRDISDERAEERQQAEFISTASHEMRTPVASIEGYLGLALNPQTASIDEKARDFITKAHQAAQHLGRLFQDLLDVSKAEDGRMQNNPQIIDVGKFLVDIVEGLQPKAEQKNLKLIYKPDSDNNDVHEKGSGRTITPMFYVYVDKDHLREVSDNLVENAIKYTPAGEVVVDVTGTDRHVTISITDTGLGIPAEDQAHLFQKFYRVDNSDTREIGGTGLGLYLCRRLVESMNGRIWVESTYKKGSTFFVELPRTSSVEAQSIIQQAEQQPKPGSAHESDIPTLDIKPQVGAPPYSPAESITAPPVTPAIAPSLTIPTSQPVPASQPVPSIFQPAPSPATTIEPQAPTRAEAAPIAPTTPAVLQNSQPIQSDPEPVLTTIPNTAIEQPAIPRPIPDFPNVQLSAIEQNPKQYIAQTEGRAINIPERNQ